MLSVSRAQPHLPAGRVARLANCTSGTRDAVRPVSTRAGERK